MRTNSLLLAAALVAGGAITSVAQTVYSVNAVGYVNLTIPVGFSMIANPLNTTNNGIAGLFSTATTPEDTTVYKWTGASFVSSTFSFGDWDNKALTLNPGEGAFISAVTAFTNTFVGEVMQGSLTNALPVGFSIRASIVPQAGTATELGLTATMNEDETVYRYNNATSRYVSSTFSFGDWDNLPSFNVGEAFWINKTAVASWVRNFSVNP
jgi:hypothetical protein